MKKEKVLLLIETDIKKDVFYNDWKNNGYQVSLIFKKVNKLFRFVRRFWMKYNLPFSYLWLGEWYNNLNSYDSIIIHMSFLTRYLPFIVNKKYPNISIKCWYWNTIASNSIPIKTNNKNIEYWSFDDNDCKKYDLNKNIQYYFRYNKTNSVKTNDIYFIGYNKNRINELKEFEEVVNQYGLKCNINIINSDKDYISYNLVKRELEKSKAVLEIVKQNQVGFTLRVLESLFFEIKLITNNKNIKNSKIYNKNNIFIIGDDNYDDLTNFINSPYDESVNVYQNDYCIETWLNNFYLK